MPDGFPVIAWTYHGNSKVASYVSQPRVPGKMDWGYTNRQEGTNGRDKALHLNRNQWQSFAKDQRECGRAAFASPAVQS